MMDLENQFLISDSHSRVGPGGRDGMPWPGWAGAQSRVRLQSVETRQCTVVADMGKFSLSNLIMCVSKYQKLNSEDYIRLGLCLPDCQDCASGQGHYVKNDKMVSLILQSTTVAHSLATSSHLLLSASNEQI